MKCQNNSKHLPELAITKDMFATEWIGGVDTEKLEKLILSAKKSAVSSFFSKLDGDDLPQAPQLADACSKMTKELQLQIVSNELLETLNRNSALEAQTSDYIAIHTASLLPPVIVPEPLSVQAILRTIPLCLNAALGAGVGFYLGGLMVRLLALPTESGMIVGAPIGAFLMIWLSMYVANNPAVRKLLLASLGIVAFADTAGQIVKNFVPLPFVKKSRFAFLGRLAGYAVAAWIIWLLKPKPSFDGRHYRQEVETIAEQWLRSAVSVIAILMYRSQQADAAGSNKNDKTEKNMATLAEITANILRQPENDRDILLWELVQAFKNFGYEMPDTEAQDEKETIFQWQDSNNERYETFGFIEAGDRVRVEKPPVIQDGNVIKKGLVKKARN